MITVCFVYFKSLKLEHLEAALYSLSKQDMTMVESVLVLDNDTSDDPHRIAAVVNGLEFTAPVFLMTHKHGDSDRTHSWSTNTVVREVTTPWVFFTRADYLLDFDTIEKFAEIAAARPSDWNGFITSNAYQISFELPRCERTDWRIAGTSALRELPGVLVDYSCIDAGVWMLRKSAFDAVGGLDESLTAWGHAQTHFQFKLHQAGTECVRLPEVLFYHPMHSAPRDINLAHQQLRDRGVDLKQMWERSHVHPYGR